MTADREHHGAATRRQSGQTNPYEGALMLIGIMALIGGLLAAGLAFEDTNDSPWPGFVAQALVMLGSLSLVGWLVVGALRRD